MARVKRAAPDRVCDWLSWGASGMQVVPIRFRVAAASAACRWFFCDWGRAIGKLRRLRFPLPPGQGPAESATKCRPYPTKRSRTPERRARGWPGGNPPPGFPALRLPRLPRHGEDDFSTAHFFSGRPHPGELSHGLPRALSTNTGDIRGPHKPGIPSAQFGPRESG